MNQYLTNTNLQKIYNTTAVGSIYQFITNVNFQFYPEVSLTTDVYDIYLLISSPTSCQFIPPNSTGGQPLIISPVVNHIINPSNIGVAFSGTSYTATGAYSVMSISDSGSILDNYNTSNFTGSLIVKEILASSLTASVLTSSGTTTLTGTTTATGLITANGSLATNTVSLLYTTVPTFTSSQIGFTTLNKFSGLTILALGTLSIINLTGYGVWIITFNVINGSFSSNTFLDCEIFINSTTVFRSSGAGNTGTSNVSGSGTYIYSNTNINNTTTLKARIVNGASITGASGYFQAVRIA